MISTGSQKAGSSPTTWGQGVPIWLSWQGPQERQSSSFPSFCLIWDRQQPSCGSARIRQRWGPKLQLPDFMLWSWQKGRVPVKTSYCYFFFSLHIATTQKMTAPSPWALQVVLDARSNAFMCSTSVMERTKRWTLPRRLGNHYHFSTPPFPPLTMS